MTFVFDGIAAWVLVGGLFAVLLIVLSDLSSATPVLGACPRHPDQDECAHRKPK